jgi:LysR family transcriptional regulator, hypochlorite-specific transcription factor HypT
MDTKWLEDFVALAETRSFSRAALMRNVTQPAFSRRIQALEAWTGASLIVRTTYPPSLTSAGESFYTQAKDVLNRVSMLKASDSGQIEVAEEAVRIALPHTLSLHYFPRWLTSLSPQLGTLNTQLLVGNVLDVVLWLVEGGCDMLICYHHPQQPIQLDMERYDMLTLGSERLTPFSGVDADGKPLFSLPGKSHHPVPFLDYSSSAYLGRMTQIAMTLGKVRPQLRKICEADMAEGLHRLVLEGHGVAFLPDGVAADDLAVGRLVRLAGGWELDMEIRAYRERPSLARPARKRMDQLWRLLEERHARPGGVSPPPVSQPTSTKVTIRRPARSSSKKELP